MALTPEQRLRLNSQTRRSNRPRAGQRLEEDDAAGYHAAVEVAGQPALNAAQRSHKKQAEATARNYEQRFPTLSERKSGGVTPKSSTVAKLYRPSR